MSSSTSLGRVAVIAGGLSHERDVSLASGLQLVQSLRDLDVEASLYEFDSKLLARLRQDDVRVAYPTLHGEMGEDGTIQTVLELAGIPFVGAPSKACRLAWDKASARVIMEQQGVSVPEWRAFSSASFRDLGAMALLESLVAELAPPLVVKPSRGGSVLGVSGVTEATELGAALVRCYAYAETAVIERFFDGIDVSVGVVAPGGSAPRALPAISLRYEKGHQFDFAARYSADLLTVEAPARLPDETATELIRVALLAHEKLGLRDVSRSDFIVNEAGRYVYLETAITPGLTRTSTFPIACKIAGSSLGEVALELLTGALKRGSQS